MMTRLINDLIRRAREQPTELTITDSQVSSVAEHARMLVFKPADQKADFETMIRAGKMKLIGIPVRVLGQE